MSDQEHIKQTLLQGTLSATVPFRILELQAQGGPTDLDRERLNGLGERLGSEGDTLLYHASRQKDQRAAGSLMGELLNAIAVMAFQPGGITTFGLHFDAGTPDAHGAVHCTSIWGMPV